MLFWLELCDKCTSTRINVCDFYMNDLDVNVDEFMRMFANDAKMGEVADIQQGCQRIQWTYISAAEIGGPMTDGILSEAA